MCQGTSEPKPVIGGQNGRERARRLECVYYIQPQAVEGHYGSIQGGFRGMARNGIGIGPSDLIPDVLGAGRADAVSGALAWFVAQELTTPGADACHERTP